MRIKTRNERQETGDRELETVNDRQKTGVRILKRGRKKTGDRK